MTNDTSLQFTNASFIEYADSSPSADANNVTQILVGVKADRNNELCADAMTSQARRRKRSQSNF